MFTFLTVLILTVSVLLIITLLLQSSKKEGLGGPLGDMRATQLIGVQQAGDLIEQITWGLIIALFTLAITISIFLRNANAPLVSPNVNRAQERNLLPSVPPKSFKKPKAPAPEPQKPAKDAKKSSQ